MPQGNLPSCQNLSSIYRKFDVICHSPADPAAIYGRRGPDVGRTGGSCTQYPPAHAPGPAAHRPALQHEVPIERDLSSRVPAVHHIELARCHRLLASNGTLYTLKHAVTKSGSPELQQGILYTITQYSFPAWKCSHKVTAYIRIIYTVYI